uniref:DUF753 domain-containing protein n=1 Tax=Anopheles dirus TaxID=7168 RepID=A0A182NUD5_9DIPT
MEFRKQCSVVVFFVAGLLATAYGNELRCYSCDDCTKQAPAIVTCNAKNGLDLSALSYTPTYPVLTQSTPYWNANPWDPILTPPPLVGGGNNGDPWYPGNPIITPPPLNGGGGNVYNPWDPLLTPPPLVGGGNNGNAWYPGNPIITPPPLNGGAGGNVYNPWDPLLTPPPLVGGNTAWNPGYPIITPPSISYPYGKAKDLRKVQKRFVCATIRSQGNDQRADLVHRRGCAEIEGYAVGVCEQGQIPVSEGGITACRVCGHSLCNE